MTHEEVQQSIKNLNQAGEDMAQAYRDIVAQKGIVFCCDCKYYVSSDLVSTAPYAHNCTARIKRSWVTKDYVADDCDIKRKSHLCNDYEAE